MLNLSAGLLSQIASTTQTLAWCWKITRKDNVVLRVTSHDRDLVMDGTYLALAGYVPSAVDTELGWNSQNQNLQAILDTPAITETDLDRGLYDYARIECFLVNYLDLPSTLTENPANRVIVYRAILGKLTRTNIRYSFEARGFESLLNNKIGSVTSKLCRARFGDSRCGVNMASYTYNSSVASVTSDRRSFTLSGASYANGWFNYGLVTFTSGPNAGAEREIASYTGNTVTLFEKAPFTVSPGNTLTIATGCDKTLKNCFRYNNVINFQGEPYIPTPDKFASTPIDPG